MIRRVELRGIVEFAEAAHGTLVRGIVALHVAVSLIQQEEVITTLDCASFAPNAHRHECQFVWNL